MKDSSVEPSEILSIIQYGLSNTKSKHYSAVKHPNSDMACSLASLITKLGLPSDLTDRLIRICNAWNVLGVDTPSMSYSDNELALEWHYSDASLIAHINTKTDPVSAYYYELINGNMSVPYTPIELDQFTTVLTQHFLDLEGR